jgi:hypothetical protein
MGSSSCSSSGGGVALIPIHLVVFVLVLIAILILILVVIFVLILIHFNVLVLFLGRIAIRGDTAITVLFTPPFLICFFLQFLHNIIRHEVIFLRMSVLLVSLNIISNGVLVVFLVILFFGWGVMEQ